MIFIFLLPAEVQVQSAAADHSLVLHNVVQQQGRKNT